MNYTTGHDTAADPRCLPDDAAAVAGYTSSSFADMIAGYSTDDLFEMVWGQGGGSGVLGSTKMPAAESCLWSPPPKVQFDPPSEAEMAAWLCAIVSGEEPASNGGAGRDAPAVKKGSSGASNTKTSSDTKGKLPMTEVMGTKQEIRKPPVVGKSSRRSQYGEAHNLTEKRRRHKINERLRTLQQLVPGCDDKSNQASTLDKTIQYMRSLQHHVKEMSGGGGVPLQKAPPMAPLMMPAAPMVLAPATSTMVPFGAMVQLPHYPAAALMMPAAAAAPLYPAAAPARAAVAPGSAESSASHRDGSTRSKRKGRQQQPSCA